MSSSVLRSGASTPASSSSSPLSPSSTSPTLSSHKSHGKWWLAKCSAPDVVQWVHDHAKIYYNEGLPLELCHAIEKDIPRVGWSKDDERYRLLGDLLQRITRRLPTYNQSLSFIGAFCLDSLAEVVVSTPQDIVDSSETIILALLFASPYRLHWLLSPRTCFLQQYIDRFDFLFARVLPELYAKLMEAHFETVFFAMDWFTTFFTNSLNKECICLVWDVLIIDQLEDAMFLCGLAVLKCVEPIIDSFSTDDLYLQFKSTCKEKISPTEFRSELQHIVRTLIPTGVIPRNYSTISLLEARLADPEDVLVQTPFDATFLMRAVQLDDYNRVGLELEKYQFPLPLLEYALFRSILLGHVRSCNVLLTRTKVDPNCPTFKFFGTMSTLKASVILNNGDVLRCLLWHIAGANQMLIGLDGLLQEVSQLRNLSGDEDSYGSVLAVLERQCCWTCGQTRHDSSSCLNSQFCMGFDSHLSCLQCGFALRTSKKRREHVCARCRFTFCDRCADTFRTTNGKAMRACSTCHHFWGSCACDVRRMIFCHHASSDFLWWKSTQRGGSEEGRDKPSWDFPEKMSGANCECEQCLGTFVRLAGKQFMQPEFANRMESLAQMALDQITVQVKQLGLKLDERRSLSS